MTTYDDVFIFVDTNKLEARVDKRVFLWEITPQKEYCDLIRLVNELGLESKVHVCIPEVVWLEVAEHMRRDYFKYKQSIIERINNERKMFGSLIDINVSFTLENNKIEYDDYIIQVQEEFLDNPKTKADIISYPKEQEILERLLDKATHTISPFSNAQSICGKKKEYTDAGFKDALIFETFVKAVKDNELGILFTSDTDFNSALDDINKDNLYCITSFIELKKMIMMNYGMQDKDIIIQTIKENAYLFEQICSELNIDTPSNIIFDSIDNVKNVDEGIAFKLALRLDGEVVRFDVIYDLNANELYTVNFSDE